VRGVELGALENVLANLVLIPLFSMQGAAAGASISQGLITLPLFVLAVQTSGRIDVPRIVSGPVLAAVLSGLGMVALRGSFGAAVVVGALLFLVPLILFERRFYPEDAQAIAAFFRRRPVEVEAEPG